MTYPVPVDDRLPHLLVELQRRIAILESQVQNSTATYNVFVCTSGTHPSSPVTGMEIYETDTANTLIWSGTAWETQVRTGVWTSYTPTLTGSLGTGTVYGAYARSGRSVTVRINFTVGSTTTFSGNIALSLPFTAATVSGPPGAMPIWTGTVLVWTASGNNQAGWAYVTTGGTTVSVSSANVGAGWSATTPQTWVNNDKFGFSITYESAS